MALKAATLKTMKPGRHPDGRYGLYFNVVGNSRTWIQRLTIDGKRRNRGLGPWPVVSLREAREIAFENVRIRHRGGNPFATAIKVRSIPTFAEAAASYIGINENAWRGNTARNWRSSMTHAGTIADRPVDTITVADVAGIVTKLLDAGKPALAKSLRQRIAKIMDWATASGHRSGPNPANGELDAILPKSTHRTEHRASVAHGDMGEVLRKVRSIDDAKWRGLTGAFELAVLTAARTSEVLGMRWSEVDFDTATWTVPASRMKAGKPHRVPLSAPALALLRAAHKRSQSGLVFRSPTGKPIDEAGLRRVAKRIELAGTVHGMRGAFKSWCMDTGIARDLAEFSLAHSFMGDVEASYVRTDLLEKRRPVMQAWGRHCDPTSI